MARFPPASRGGGGDCPSGLCRGGAARLVFRFRLTNIRCRDESGGYKRSSQGRERLVEERPRVDRRNPCREEDALMWLLLVFAVLGVLIVELTDDR